MSAKPLAELIEDCIAPVLAAQGFATRAIVTLWPEIVSEKRFAELLALESVVDLLAQGAFEVYCRCREQVAGIGLEQVRRRYDRLLRRCGLLADDADLVDDPPTPAS